MKKFLSEFKKFTTRGNVVDMSVGVIIGGAFTAIVNGMGNNILKPLINYFLMLVFGKDSLTEIYTFLDKKFLLDEAGIATSEVDLANSIYIDWGAFINAVINFLITAFVLFCVVRFINHAKERDEKIKKHLRVSREDRKEMRKQGIKRKDAAAVAAFFAAKDEAAAVEKAAAEEKARLEREANPTTEDLLKKILVVLETK